MDRPPDLDPASQFRELYEREYRAVYRTIRAMVFDSTLAEDLSQETFVRAYRSRDRYRPTGPVGAWLHRIAVNVTISHLRREKLSRLLAPKLLMGPGSGGYERVEAKTLLERGLARLSPRVRAAVVLHYYHGYTRDEVARILGIPSGTVASRIAKAMALMRQELAGNEQMVIQARSGE
ncbi:MAG TPA: RNA polymerase sigma factor [Candidatus Dormibacteraeota bacterium]|nr:RNA polymerase sigma factor [Candidatus Dormibacteraeota bacterium]